MVEIGAEAALIPEKEYIYDIFVAVCVIMMDQNTLKFVQFNIPSKFLL